MVNTIIHIFLCFSPKVTERVSYLVGHHHTYDHIDGMDYQILVEADFLVNFNENVNEGMEVENVLQNSNMR